MRPILRTSLPFVTVLVLVGTWAAPLSSARADENDAARHRWQLKEYPNLTRIFSKELAYDANPAPIPTDPKDLYLWQLDPYRDLRASFHREFTAKLNVPPVPEKTSELYAWQLAEHSNLRKTFRTELQSHQDEKLPFTP